MNAALLRAGFDMPGFGSRSRSWSRSWSDSGSGSGAWSGSVSGSGSWSRFWSRSWSRSRYRYRPGQGAVGRFTFLFSEPAANSILVAGVGTAESRSVSGSRRAS